MDKISLPEKHVKYSQTCNNNDNSNNKHVYIIIIIIKHVIKKNTSLIQKIDRT